jgi:hypothetical protein
VLRVSHAGAESAQIQAGPTTQGSAPARPLPPAGEPASFDSTAESAPDSAASAAADAARAEHLLVVGHLDEQARQTRLDRLRAAFDADQAERAESLRELNVLRDMALEQQKHDDEILKKWIALI